MTALPGSDAARHRSCFDNGGTRLLEALISRKVEPPGVGRHGLMSSFGHFVAVFIFCWLCLLSKPICAADGIALSSDSFTLTFAADGRPASCQRKADGVDLFQACNAGQGFYLKSPEAAAVRLTQLAVRPDGRFSARSDGEVSWASSAWGWRMETKSTDYEKVRRVKIGFGELPPCGQPAVNVEQLTALGEIPMALENPIVRVGAGQLRVRGSIPSGHFLQYPGGDKAILYDENWHRLAEFPAEKDNYAMPSGQASVTVSTGQAGSTPWLEVQFLTAGTPISVGDSLN